MNPAEARAAAIVSSLHTIATRTWATPAGEDRAERLAELRAVAGDRTDLLAKAASLLLGSRPPDVHDPRHRQATYGAELLLELAGVAEDTPEVLEWAERGAERRPRWRRPEPPRGIA